MNPRRSRIVFFACLLIARVGHGQSAPPDPVAGEISTIAAGVTGSWKTGIYSRYFASGDGLVLADEPVAQSELKMNWFRGPLSVSLKADLSKGFRQNWGSFADEVDLGTEVIYAGPLDLTVGYTHLFLVPTAGGDVHYAKIKLSKDLKLGSQDLLTPSLEYDYFWPSNPAGPRSGTLLNSGLVYTHFVRTWFDINEEIHFIRDINGPFGLRPQTNVYSYEGSVDISVGRGWALTPKIDYGGAFNDTNRPGKLTLGFEFLKTFSPHKQ
jgi:hypothetical protein